MVTISIAATVGLGLVLWSNHANRAHVEEKTGVIESVHKLAKRVQVFTTERLSAVFVAASKGEEALNDERMPATPHDPDAQPSESSSFPPTAGEVVSGSQENASGDLVVFDKTVVDRGHTSHIAEPSVATDGKRVLSVWNWGAAASADGGKTFDYLDPHSFEAGKSSPLPFCCDQLAYYVPSQDLWIWLLQYRGPDGQRERNVIRLAYAVGGDAFDRREFATFDLAASDVAGKRSEAGRTMDGDAYLDFSRIAASNGELFVSVNVFPTVESAYRGSVVIRVPLAELVSHRPHADWYLTDLGTAGLTTGATDAMYFAVHRTDSTLEVCRWPDAADTPSCADVEHSPHPSPRGEAYHCQRDGAPPESDWCERLTDGRPTHDDRPQSGWVAGGLVGFSWDVKQDPANGFPYPFTAVVRIDQSTMKLHDEPVIWGSDRAYEYAAIVPNSRGDLGAVALIGGGEHYATCVALERGADAPADAGWESEVVDVSDSDSVRPASGDYLGVSPAAPSSNTWMGACMTLHGGGEQGDVEIRVFSFGRAEDRTG